jgi:hypothetical protein
MTCVVDTCNEIARYSASGLCMLHYDRYRERIGVIDDRSRYNVPGSITYDSSEPLDYQVQSLENPTAIRFDGVDFFLSDGGTFGLAVDTDGFFYPSTNSNLVQYYIKIDDDAVPYISDAQEIA